jgi:hypothetical protein
MRVLRTCGLTFRVQIGVCLFAGLLAAAATTTAFEIEFVPLEEFGARWWSTLTRPGSLDIGTGQRLL